MHSIANFPLITLKQGASNTITPILLGTNIRVQTIVIEHVQWGSSLKEIAAEYDLSLQQVNQAMAFYHAHKPEIDGMIAREVAFANELYAKAQATKYSNSS